MNAPFVPQVVKNLSATSLGASDDQLITNQGAAGIPDLLADSAIWLTCLISVWVMILFWPVSRILSEYKKVDLMVPRRKSLWGRMKRAGLVSWSLLLAITLLVCMSTTAEAGCCCHAELNSCCELKASWSLHCVLLSQALTLLICTLKIGSMIL